MDALIALLPGDGIGPEVLAAGRELLEAVGRQFGHRFELREGLIGGAAIDACGDPLPAETETLCRSAAAVLLGAVGGPKWSDPSAPVRPEQGLLRLRAALGVFANLRPVRPHPRLRDSAPLKSDRLVGVDLLFVRELTGGSYFGRKGRDADGAFDECRYSEAEIERVTDVAAGLARARGGRITQVDKANVLETSRLWRSTVTRRIAEQHADVQVEHQLVDSMAMHLLTQPARFDVILTENLFGDILTDEAAVLAGSIGLLPSASIGANGGGLYEPIHGSAPDIAGQQKANPVGTMASVALLLRHALGLETEAQAVEAAIDACIDRGIGTVDVFGAQGQSTAAVTAAVIEALSEGARAAA
ncbi:MAG: 3-isopropylmalate dehydrogenase [Lysobacterales bacterium]